MWVIKMEESVNEGFDSYVEEFLSKDNNVDFWNEVENFKAGELTKDNVLNLAKRYEVNPQDAIRFVKEMYQINWPEEGELDKEYQDLVDMHRRGDLDNEDFSKYTNKGDMF